jgi:hypothetical protein
MAGTLHRLTVEGVGAASLSGKAINVCHYSANNTATITDHQTVVTKLKDFYTSCAGIFPNNLSITVGTRVIALKTVPEIVPVTPASVALTSNASNEPAQLALCVAWRTLKAGPRYRGRTFLGPLYLGAMATNGAVVPAQITAVNNAATTLLAAVQGIGADWGLVVYSRKFNTSEFIVGGATNSRVDILRRRG